MSKTRLTSEDIQEALEEEVGISSEQVSLAELVNSEISEGLRWYAESIEPGWEEECFLEIYQLNEFQAQCTNLSEITSLYIQLLRNEGAEILPEGITLKYQREVFRQKKCPGKSFRAKIGKMFSVHSVVYCNKSNHLVIYTLKEPA